MVLTCPAGATGPVAPTEPAGANGQDADTAVITALQKPDHIPFGGGRQLAKSDQCFKLRGCFRTEVDVNELQSRFSNVTRDTDTNGFDPLLFTGIKLQVVDGSGIPMVRSTA
jgi:hypothetical protein